MTIELIKCDECGKVKGEANHWLQIAIVVHNPDERPLSVVIGSITAFKGITNQPQISLRVHDLCGQACFHAHLDKLMKKKAYPTKPQCGKFQKVEEHELQNTK